MSDPDHREMKPPSLRLSKKIEAGPEGRSVCVWDLRIAQPNVSNIDPKVLHSLEHFLGSIMPKMSSAIVNVAPLGCQTGFYIVAFDVDDFEQMATWLEASLQRTLEAEEVPLANDLQCGWAENHTLVGAQRVADWLLRRREEWANAVWTSS